MAIAIFNSRKTYFDGLGTVIENATTSEEAIKLSKLDYEVVKTPLFTKNSMGFITPVANNFATMRTDTNQILGVVGKNYNILQNKEAFDFLDSLVKGGAKIETGGTYRGSAASFITASTEPMKILEDEFKPYLLFMNSFDGSGAVRAMFTTIRVFCSNCLLLAIKNASNKISIRHSATMKGRLAQAQQILFQNTKYLEELNQISEKLAAAKFSAADFEKMGKMLFPIEDGVSLVINQRQEQKFETLRAAYNQSDLQNYNGTAYKALQAVADYESHQPRFRDTQNPFADMQTVIMGMPLLNEVFSRLKDLVAV